MIQIENLIERLKADCEGTYWLGAASATEIKRLQETLGLNFPTDFIAFLRLCGGGGAEHSEICGVCDDDASLKVGGTDQPPRLGRCKVKPTRSYSCTREPSNV